MWGGKKKKKQKKKKNKRRREGRNLVRKVKKAYVGFFCLPLLTPLSFRFCIAIPFHFLLTVFLPSNRLFPYDVFCVFPFIVPTARPFPLVAFLPSYALLLLSCYARWVLPSSSSLPACPARSPACSVFHSPIVALLPPIIFYLVPRPIRSHPYHLPPRL